MDRPIESINFVIPFGHLHILPSNWKIVENIRFASPLLTATTALMASINDVVDVALAIYIAIH